MAVLRPIHVSIIPCCYFSSAVIVFLQETVGTHVFEWLDKIELCGKYLDYVVSKTVSLFGVCDLITFVLTAVVFKCMT